MHFKLHSQEGKERKNMSDSLYELTGQALDLKQMAFDGEEIKFPYDDLNLNGLTIIYEDYAN